MSATAKLQYFVRTALGSLVRAPFVHLIAIASLALALVGYGSARIAQARLVGMMKSFGGQAELVVYLHDGQPPDKLDALAQALAERAHGEATLVSPRTALQRLAAELDEPALLGADLGDNPLPWSVELKLPVGERDPSRLKGLADQVRALPFVRGVDFGQEAVEALAQIEQALRLAGLFAFALVFLTAVIVVSATLQLAIFARKDEIEIQKLVGATDLFVRLPFLIEGMLQGAIASVLALGALKLAGRALAQGALRNVGLLIAEPGFVVDWRRLALECLGIGLALGLVGSFIAVRRFLKV